MCCGYVYCFSNDSMPGILKVGFTSKTPNVILNEANSVDIWKPPTQYMVQCAKKVSNINTMGSSLKKLLSKYSYQNSKDFYWISLEEVKLFFDLMDGDLWINEQSDSVIILADCGNGEEGVEEEDGEEEDGEEEDGEEEDSEEEDEEEDGEEEDSEEEDSEEEDEEEDSEEEDSEEEDSEEENLEIQRRLNEEQRQRMKDELNGLMEKVKESERQRKYTEEDGEEEGEEDREEEDSEEEDSEEEDSEEEDSEEDSEDDEEEPNECYGCQRQLPWYGGRCVLEGDGVCKMVGNFHRYYREYYITECGYIYHWHKNKLSGISKDGIRTIWIIPRIPLYARGNLTSLKRVGYEGGEEEESEEPEIKSERKRRLKEEDLEIQRRLKEEQRKQIEEESERQRRLYEKQMSSVNRKYWLSWQHL